MATLTTLVSGQEVFAEHVEPETAIWCGTDGDIVRGGSFWTDGDCEIFVDGFIDEEFEDVEIHGDLALFGEGRCRSAETELTIEINDNGFEGTITIESTGESCRNPPNVNGEHDFTITGATGDFDFIVGGSGLLEDDGNGLFTEMDSGRNFDLDIHGTLDVVIPNIDHETPIGNDDCDDDFATALKARPIITSVTPTVDGIVVEWKQQELDADFRFFFFTFHIACAYPVSFDIESNGVEVGSYTDEENSSGTFKISNLDCATNYDIEVIAEWATPFYGDGFLNGKFIESGIESVTTLDCVRSGGSTCNVPPTFGTPFTCAVRNFVDDGVSIHGTSYDPTSELHIENPQINAVVGLTYSIQLSPYESSGESNIKWVGVSIGLVEGDFIFGNGQALAYLHQSFDGTFTVEEDDPTDIIEVRSFTKAGEKQCAVSDNDSMCPIYELKYKYREAPIGNMVGVQVVNHGGESENRFFNDGIDVTGDSMNPSIVIEVLADEKFVAKHYLTFVDPSFKDRTVAVDENGIIWNKVGNFWSTEHLMPDTSCDVSGMGTGYDRTCPEFSMQMQGQEMVALDTLNTMYPNINRDDSFNEIDRVFAYEYPTTSQREQTLQTLVWHTAN